MGSARALSVAVHGDVADPLEICLSTISGHSRSNCESVMKEIPVKNLTSFKSLEVIGTDTDRSAAYNFV